MAFERSTNLSATRIPSLDGLRALAIGLVLLCHFTDYPDLARLASMILGRYGHAGVRIFFVISGFLITTLLLQERNRFGRIDVKKFYVRRAYRILPVAYLYMIFVTAAFFSTLTAKDIAVSFTYSTAYVNDRPYVLTHLWSLSVEEQFYLVWPAIVVISVVLARWVAVGVVVGAPIIRLLMMTAHLGQSRLLPISADALAIGCLLALLQPRLSNISFFKRPSCRAIWILALAIPALAAGGRTYQCVLMPIFDVAVALGIQSAIRAKYSLFNAAIPVWIGRVSYSLYLWHMPFSELSRRVWYTRFPINIVLSFLVAATSYYVVEQPILRFRDRKRQSQSLLPHSPMESA